MKLNNPMQHARRRSTGPLGGLLLILCLLLGLPLQAAQPPGQAIATAHPLATRAGVAMLRQGGNAFDAAVSVAAVLAVVEPYGSGLGGGGFWLLHRAADGHETLLDGRETAPLQARAELYLDAQGHADPELSLNGPLAAAIPGVPAALERLARDYGKLPLSASLAPAIRLAREGFVVDQSLRHYIQMRREVLARSPATASIFLIDGEAPPLGSSIRQPDLARSLELIAEQGADAFYRGELAQRLVEGVRGAGGIWQQADLSRYQLVEREPLRGEFLGMRISAAPPPSSGGATLIQALNLMEQIPEQLDDEVGRIHWLTESLRRAYRDRAEFLGDADFVEIPLDRLLSKDRARQLAADIDPLRASASADLPPIPPDQSKKGTKGEDTSHYSIIDAEGNRVAATLSINTPFGSGFMVPGTGILLNNQMDDFAIQPGSPNAYGLVGAQANALAPGKRPLSSMAPTFLETANGLAILGTPGGSRIISMVLLTSLGHYGGASAGELVARPRFHHQYLPDQLLHEPDVFRPELAQRLTAMGHRLQPSSGGKDGNGRYGNMQLVLWRKDQNRLEAASDPRGIGCSWVETEDK
ncbi:gamma-glutamyltransferase [Magnetovirga frankeli]|uniref:gamma-glutamyltransferase n=1 Tax=Magnetovirga frankeli TaxID=947516 RepID=UPI003D3576DD